MRSWGRSNYAADALLDLFFAAVANYFLLSSVGVCVEMPCLGRFLISNAVFMDHVSRKVNTKKTMNSRAQ